MKYKILITIIVLLSFNSCKKDDYRDKFVGIYYGASTCILSNVPPIEDSIYIIVSKLEDNKLTFSVNGKLSFSNIVENDGTVKEIKPMTSSSVGTITNNYLNYYYENLPKHCFFNGTKQ